MRIIIDLTGKRFGRLTVLEMAVRDRNNFIRWKCRCDCGKVTITYGTSLRGNKTQSCGCLNVERVKSLDSRKNLRQKNLGKKHSEETKSKMSASHKGKNTWSSGTKWTDAQKEKLKSRTAWNAGKIGECPQLGNPQRGSKSHRWKGGITPINKAIRNSVEYKKWRREVFKRDDFTCQQCGIRGGTLNADHIKSFALYIELRFDLSNGRTLCVPCHRKTPNFGSKAKR